MQFARTRKELLNLLWNEGESEFNIFKEGPKYTVQVRNNLGRVFHCATGVRCIDSLSVADWRELLSTKRWETFQGVRT